jgi:hypothetical protein
MSKKLKTPNVMKLTFGKYNGTEIADLVNIDIDYLIWLACNSHSVRKEAQSIYINWLRSNYSSIKDYTILSQTYDNDLNWVVVFLVEGKRYTSVFRLRSDFDELVKSGFDINFNLGYQIVFKDKYEGVGYKKRWCGATLMDVKPYINFIRK